MHKTKLKKDCHIVSTNVGRYIGSLVFSWVQTSALINTQTNKVSYTHPSMHKQLHPHPTPPSLCYNFCFLLEEIIVVTLKP